MATKKRGAAAKRATKRTRTGGLATGQGATDLPPTPQPFLADQLAGSLPSRRPVARKPRAADALRQRMRDFDVEPSVTEDSLRRTLDRIDPKATVPIARLPEDIQETIATLKPRLRRFHGAKLSLAWFPRPLITSKCADMFGYMSSPLVRSQTRLPFNATTTGLMDALGALMADPGRDVNDSTIPAGFTYLGQFVDHDITLDISSRLDAPTDANTVHNMRTPMLDLDSVYGRGPALDSFLYAFPSTGPATAIKLQLGSNRPSGVGGPGGSAGPGGMKAQVDFDVPRVHSTFNPSASTNTAIIGDPRNDENLIVVQFHQTMLRFHNRVVEMLVLNGFNGDIFVEARRIVTQHYQWAVVNDFLKRICGGATVSSALSSVTAPVGSAFRMPVEFAVAAYRFGHSMVRERYWVSAAQPAATMADVFNFSRNPNLPVLSNWVVDFNAFFETGVPVAIFNNARAIDSVLTPQLESLPGLIGLMAILAARNLRRGLALGLPSGQGMAKVFGIAPMTPAELMQGLPPNEVAVLQSNAGLLLKKTPLWYYVLREAAVLNAANQLGPVGGRIVAETFVRMLKRDGGSYLNVGGSGFTPFLPSAAAADFTFADLVIFAGVSQP